MIDDNSVTIGFFTTAELQAELKRRECVARGHLPGPDFHSRTVTSTAVGYVEVTCYCKEVIWVRKDPVVVIAPPEAPRITSVNRESPCRR